VVGLGYAGLTLAVTLADAGARGVVGVETSRSVLASLERGEAHFHEVGLNPLLQYHLRREQLKITSDVDSVDADVFIIAVGTPVNEVGEAQLDELRGATCSLRSRLSARWKERRWKSSVACRRSSAAMTGPASR